MTGHTPLLAYPYPEPSDPPRGWEQIQALAEALDQQAKPVTRELPLKAEYAKKTAFYYRQNGRVHLFGQIRRADGGKMNAGSEEFLTSWAPDARPPSYFSATVTVVGVSGLAIFSPVLRVDVNTGYLKAVGGDPKYQFTAVNLTGLSWPIAIEHNPDAAAAFPASYEAGP
ncbi:hypothetical protein GCM10010329_50080 [Streptomyces spiroverticillatus]|uniref:Uncharacterized protein n=1 Tax=Streptomyces finlayi TaxID=67296 RepID=A0A919CC74_9ACTN|nr:hypothetical protein [Streptomyces finlayi]GHA20679.1 hypothetical protein GCM10010329_50080 [Streptomyces spiroverticillatus]GHD03360.1 hypothetical protein GCM10010334_51030 [Streptomyces finlayi]